MKLERDFLLSKITTFQLGGPARFYLSVTSPEEVVAAVLIVQTKKLKYCLVGGGSNLVFTDRGFSGLIIHWQIIRPRPVDLMIKGQEIIAAAGIRLNDLVDFINKHSLVGLEKMAGIPGTVGGAIVGNAGAYGQTISDHLKWVEIFDGEKIRRLTKKNCCFDYRESIFKHQPWLVLRMGFKLKKGQARDLISESKKIKKIRWSKFGQYPICAGSFFKNPIVKGKKIPAAKIIEETKLANLQTGGIKVATWHHNFLINDGSGTTRDLIKLKEKIKKVVHRKLGIKLEEEVRFIV